MILDCCHSGIAGNVDNWKAELREGLTILTASTKDQQALEVNGRGIFTNLLIDALEGAAANILGSISPGSVYAHIDQSLGDWDQRPVFKTHVKKFIPLRKVTPAISLTNLQHITEFFPRRDHEYQLSPEYEPERSESDKKKYPPPDPEKTKIFAILQKYNRLNLLVPLDAPHMWHAAMQSKSCKLTRLGEHFRRLVAEDLL